MLHSDDPAAQKPSPAPASAKKWRLAVLLSHPIQYQVPLLRRLDAHPDVDLMVYFMSDIGVRAGYVKGYGETLKWDIPLLDGYRYEFLKNHSPRQDIVHPTSKIHFGIVEALRKGRFDALYLHGYMSVTEWVAYATAKALGIPILFHGDVLIDSPTKAPLSRSAIAREAFRRAFCGGFDAALALSTQAKMFYEKYGVPKERVFWAPLCVDNEAWMSKSDALRPTRAELRAELGVDPELPVILYVAHMRPNKRPVDVAQAFERMKTKASLVMVGNGPLFEELQAYVRDHGLARVHLAGSRNQAELPKFYAMADAFVLPSGPGEVTPLVIHEAMCSSLPLVISDAVPSIIDFVREGENGFTYPLGDLDALADRLDRVLGDPARQAVMGRRSRELISAWTYDVAVAGILDALAYVRDGRGRG